jgi:pimeloyl-ACP methyl ester carboxylesterase
MHKYILQKIAFSLFALVIFSSHSFSQKTGQYNQTITFNGESRTISMYVPADYNPANKYQLMVCLHGLGDNSTNFRNALINSLKWNNLPNTIFACPDGGSDQNKDFYSPAGDEEIIPTTIAFVRDSFNIDTTKIVLEGFSLGGRSALKYGLDNPTKFKALFLNTPAMQGPMDALNLAPVSLMFNYKNASKIPIAITVGEQDLYSFIIPLTLDKLIENDCKVIYVEVPGMGHSIPGQTYTGKCWNFLENPPENQYDVELRRVDVPERICNSTRVPKCKFRNLGSETITSAIFEFNFNGMTKDYTWTGNLLPFHNATLNIPESTLKDGDNDFTFTVKELNSAKNDTIPENNIISGRCKMYGTRNSLPLVESFEDPTNFPAKDWFTKTSGNLFSWDQDNSSKKSGLYSIAMFNSAQLFYNLGMTEELHSPIVDLTKIPKPLLVFDIAFNYLHYTPPQVQIERDFTDTLEISISTDCGVTYEVLYRKSGADLATAESPILNAQSLQGEIFYPSDDEWRNDAIDLSSFATQDNVSFRFSYISGWGGTIYLDNISIVDKNFESIELETPSSIGVYPNPATDFIEISVGANGPSPLQILDIYGQTVLTVGAIHELPLRVDVSGLAPGMYFVRIGDRATKFVKL